MALRGIRVLEFAGLAPVPFCGMILADFGAEVIRVDRAGAELAPSGNELLGRGKKSIVLNLKDPASISVLEKIIPSIDVVLEPFRPGVMERLGLGPEKLLSINPRLVYARLTGYGQTGPLKDRAGHDINYLANSGMLSVFKRRGNAPLFPANILGDFAAGSLSCAFGIVTALLERTKSGKGQVIDAAIVDGSVYLGSFVYLASKTPLWDQPAGENVLDSGSPNYDVYETKDGHYMAVGALEPQFYEQLLKGLFGAWDRPENLPPVLDRDQWPKLKAIFTKRFKEKTRDEWTAIFANTDACVSPILNLNEIDQRHLSPTKQGPQPSPSPILSRTPATVSEDAPEIGQHTTQVLQELGISKQDIDALALKTKLPRAKL